MNEISQNIKQKAKQLLNRIEPAGSGGENSKSYFHSDRYLRYNQRVLEHLASLPLKIANSAVLEVGAGIGDHTSYFLDRGCQVFSTDARSSNVELLQKRYPGLRIGLLDLESPELAGEDIFEIVYCYGVLYHLSKPAQALAFMAEHCSRLLLLQTCVSLGSDQSINLCSEPINDPTQSASGYGCRPTRAWVYAELKKHFEFVYLPLSQPNNEEFPLDWTKNSHHCLARAIFIGSRFKLDEEIFREELVSKQIRGA